MNHQSHNRWMSRVRRCLTVAALMAAPAQVAGAACPDAVNNVPGCQFNSEDDYLAFQFQDLAGSSSFEAEEGYIAPGSLAIAETTGNQVRVQSSCFPASLSPDFLYGVHLRLVPPATAGLCSLQMYLFDDHTCSFILEVLTHSANLAPGWNRLEGQRSLSILTGAYMVLGCQSMSDGGILQIDDAFAGGILFYDTFESATIDAWSFVHVE